MTGYSLLDLRFRFGASARRFKEPGAYGAHCSEPKKEALACDLGHPFLLDQCKPFVGGDCICIFAIGAR